VKVLWDWIGGRMGEIPYCLAGGEVEADVEDFKSHLAGAVEVYGGTWGLGHVS
jgi:hypothetical protein